MCQRGAGLAVLLTVQRLWQAQVGAGTGEGSEGSRPGARPRARAAGGQASPQALSADAAVILSVAAPHLRPPALFPPVPFPLDGRPLRATLLVFAVTVASAL